MKKLILSAIILLTVVFFSSQKANAQTDPECYRVYQNEEYKCLQTRTKCIQSCSSVNNLKACQDSCSAQDKLCSNQASADLKACLAAIPKEGTKVSTEANAQPKNITCEEWKNIAGIEKCKYSVVTSTVTGDAINPRRDPPNSIWCSDTTDITDTYINLPVDYEYATSDEKCIYDVTVNLYSGQETNKVETAGSQQSTATQTKELEEPAGRGIGEFIRKIQSIRLNPFNKPSDKEIIEPVKEQVSNTEQKTPDQTIDDWIMENIGVTDFSKAYKTERPPVLKAQAGTDEALLLTYEIISPTPGSKVDTSGNGVLITKPDGSTLWIKEDGDVIYYQRANGSTYKLNDGEMEVKTGGNSVDVETPNAAIKSKGTHYWVLYDPKKKETTVGVYEGVVEIKTKDGKTTTVTPNNDNPGVVVVSQKLSPVKLVLVGLVVITVLGGIVLILRKRLLSNLLKKKR